jgi:predicted nucleic acid-binding protein
VTLRLADTSAWHHSADPAVAGHWTEGLATDALATCAQVRLEVLFSARSEYDYDRIVEEFASLHQLPCGEREFERALDVQRLLAHRGGLHHRSVKIPDLVIAASAESAGAIIWHYDEDFDRIAEATRQPTEWIAVRGSL